MISMLVMKEMGSLFCSLGESLGLKGGSSSSSIVSTGPGAIKLSPSKQQQALHDFQPKARQAALPIADQSVATATQPKEAKDLAPDPTSNGQHNAEQVGISAEDYELATFKALQQRQQSKLPPKAAKKDTKNAAKKSKKQDSSSKGNTGGPDGSKPGVPLAKANKDMVMVTRLCAQATPSHLCRRQTLKLPGMPISAGTTARPGFMPEMSPR
jgi:hypothetical protein